MSVPEITYDADEIVRMTKGEEYLYPFRMVKMEDNMWTYGFCAGNPAFLPDFKTAVIWIPKPITISHNGNDEIYVPLGLGFSFGAVKRFSKFFGSGGDRIKVPIVNKPDNKYMLYIRYEKKFVVECPSYEPVPVWSNIHKADVQTMDWYKVTLWEGKLDKEHENWKVMGLGVSNYEPEKPPNRIQIFSRDFAISDSETVSTAMQSVPAYAVNPALFNDIGSDVHEPSGAISVPDTNGDYITVYKCWPDNNFGGKLRLEPLLDFLIENGKAQESGDSSRKSYQTTEMPMPPMFIKFCCMGVKETMKDIKNRKDVSVCGSLNGSNVLCDALMTKHCTGNSYLKLANDPSCACINAKLQYPHIEVASCFSDECNLNGYKPSTRGKCEFTNITCQQIIEAKGSEVNIKGNTFQTQCGTYMNKKSEADDNNNIATWLKKNWYIVVLIVMLLIFVGVVVSVNKDKNPKDKSAKQKPDPNLVATSSNNA